MQGMQLSQARHRRALSQGLEVARNRANLDSSRPVRGCNGSQTAGAMTMTGRQPTARHRQLCCGRMRGEALWKPTHIAFESREAPLRICPSSGYLCISVASHEDVSSEPWDLVSAGPCEATTACCDSRRGSSTAANGSAQPPFDRDAGMAELLGCRRSKALPPET